MASLTLRAPGGLLFIDGSNYLESPDSPINITTILTSPKGRTTKLESYI